MKRHWFPCLTLVVAGFTFAGCSEKEAAPPAPQTSTVAGTTTAPNETAPAGTPAPPADGAASGAMAGGGGAPMMGGGAKLTMAQAVEEAPKDDKALVPLAEAFTKSEAKLKADPKDAAAKKAFVEAAYNYGHAAEYSDALGPRVKYRAALYLYRKALATDPQHAPSVKEKDQIEQIYAGMPGGVPKE